MKLSHSQNQIEWLKCETEDEYIYTNCCGTNDVLYLGFTATGFAGPTGCYTIVGLNANQDTVPCTAIEEVQCSDDICLPEELKFQYRNCGSEEWVDTESDLTQFAPSDGTIYTWGDDNATCYEIRQNAASSGAGSPIDLGTDPIEYTATQDPCKCCANYNVVQYSQCDIADPAEGCSNMLGTIYLINPNYPAQAPATALIQDNNNNTCCYTLDGTSCENPTANYSFSGLAISGCNDEPCTAASPKFKFLYTQCATATAVSCTSMDKDVILELEEGEDIEFAILSDGKQECCYSKVEQVEEGEIDNYTITGTFDNCEEQSLPQQCLADDPVERWLYVKCVEATACSEDIASEVIIEGPASTLANFLVLQDPATENTCCYVKETESESPVTGYTIFGPLGGCDEESLVDAGCAPA